MANIANVRRFDGVNDMIRFTSTDLVSAYGPLTVAVIIKSAINDGAGYQDIVAVEGGTGGRWAFLHIDIGAADAGLATYFDAPGVGYEVGGAFTPAMGWCVIVTTIQTSAANADVHRYEYPITTWTHTSPGGGAVLTGPAPTGTPNLYVGTWNNAIEFLDADVACIGIWKATDLTTPQVETLHANIGAWETLSPTILWLFDQPDVGTPVLDRMGNADQVAITGTTVVTPTGLTFDVGGAAIEPTYQKVGMGIVS